MNLEPIFNPKSVAIIGASDEQKSVGKGLVDNLLQGGAKRKIYPINPNEGKIAGQKIYPSIKQVKGKIDLAVIAVPAEIVPQVASECVEKKVGGIIVISAGFAETGKRGKKRQEKISRLASEANIPLVGPNCLGIIRPQNKLNASFAPTTPKKGGITLISQSGALIDSIIDKSLGQHFGFSNIISYGNEAGLELTDFIKYADKDPKTKAITLYVEGLKDGRKFYKTTKKISPKTPILALKGGKSRKAQKAVSTHTGSIAGQAEIYSAAFGQAGIKEVDSIQSLLDSAKALAWQPRCKNSIGIVTNGGGAGVLATDYCEKNNIHLANLTGETIEKIKKAQNIPEEATAKNPLDIIGDAGSARYQDAVHIMLERGTIAGIIAIQTIQTMTEPEKTAEILIKAHKKWPQKPIITSFMGGKSIRNGAKKLEKNNIPNYPDPQRAVDSLKSLIK